MCSEISQIYAQLLPTAIVSSTPFLYPFVIVFKNSLILIGRYW